MIEEYGDFWNLKGDARCITTNGKLRKNGNAIMGAGVALQARNKCLTKGIDLEAILGRYINEHGNHVFLLCNNLISFPTKTDWVKNADINLIIRSANELKMLANRTKYRRILMTRPGCGNGRLDWRIVKPVIEFILDDRFVIVSYHR